VRILLINQYFPPDTSATAKMAGLVVEKLAERHQVIVLAGRPSYEPTERHPVYLFRKETKDHVSICRLGSTAYPRHRMRHRVSNYLSYLSLAVPCALGLPADLVMAMTDPPVAGIAGALVARLRGLPFVYNVRDLYPDMALGGGILQPSGWVRAWEKLHRRALREARKVIVLGDDMRERIRAKGVDEKRIVVVRDGAALAGGIPPADHPVAREIRGDYRFVALHAGNLGFYGAWETLVQAARLLEKEGFGLVFVGEGAEKTRVEAAADGCAAIRFLPFRPPEEIPYVLAAGDVHVITLRRELAGVVVPSKLYPILAAGRPVLVVAPESCDAARIVRRTGSGIVADPDDPAAVAAAIRELARDGERLEGMGSRARVAAQEFERSGQLELFLRAVEEAAQG
jgi:putative colanic acid biosynthesis glycosyltransferase WcaI